MSESEGRGDAWTEEQSDEGKRRLKGAPEASGPALTEPDLAGLRADGTETVVLTQASTPTEARLIAERIAAAGGTERPPVSLGPPGNQGARLPGALLEDSDDVRLVPVRVAWLPAERAGRRVARLADLLPGQDPYHPNERQQQQILSREPDRAIVLAGEPATIGSLRGQWAEITGGGDPADFGSYVVRRATLALDRAEYQLLGPRYKTPSLVREEILSSRRFRSGLRGVQRGPDEPPPSLAEAEKILDELVAGWSRRLIDIMPNLGRLIFQRGFDRQIDYDDAQVERLRAAMQRYPGIFLWSHRSNLDNLVLSAAMQEKGLPPAHVFGGINMAFGPMGAILRRAGVIFIRRSTGDDPLYKYVLREYVGYVLEKRFNLSWSIEGTRSRTGKQLPPRLGLLSYAADAYLQGRVDDILLVPVSITYDQLHEIAEYADYARGGQKKPEGFGWLYGFIKAQGARHYGKIYVRFDEPVTLSSFLGPPNGPTATDPAALRLALQKTAFEVSWRINQGMPVTATAIITTILLAMRGTALTFGQIRLGLADATGYLDSRAIPTTASARALTAAEPVRATLDALREGGLVTYVAEGREPVWLIEPEHQLAATFYRNSLIHFLLDTALCEPAVLRARDDSTDPVGAFWAEIGYLRDLLKFDFYFRERDEYRRGVHQEMDRHDPAWEQRLRSGPDEADVLLAHMRPLVSHVIVRPFVEAYRLVADVLASEDPPDDDAAVIQRALGLGRQYAAQGRLRSSESVSVLLFQTGLQLARNRGLFEPGEDLAKRRTGFLNELRDLLRRLDRIEDIAIRRYIADAAIAQRAELGTGLDGGSAGDQGLRVIQAPLGQRLDRMLAGPGRRTWQLPGGAGEPRRGGRLDHAVGGDVRPPRDQVRVAGRLGQRQDRLHARLAPGEDGGPLVPGALGEPRRQPGAQLRPVPRVVAVGHTGQAEAGQQRGVEPRLQGPDRHPLRVHCLVDVIPGHAAVEQVDPALIAPQALGHQHKRHGEQRRHSVHDGGVDHLAPSGGGALDQGRAYAVRHQHPAAAEVAEQVRGKLRRTAGPPQGVQGAGPGDVPDVVPDRRGQRPVLAPPGHTGVDQPGIAGQADIGPGAEALGHPGPEAFQQHVGRVDEPQQRVDRAGMLQVQYRGPAAAIQQLLPRPSPAGPWPVDAQHGRAGVGEHHGAERRRPDARELEHPHPGQRPAAGVIRTWSRFAHVDATSGNGRPWPDGGTTNRSEKWL